MELPKSRLTVCNHCGKVYVDTNADKQPEFPIMGYPMLETLQDEDGFYQGCPECETDGDLADIKDADQLLYSLRSLMDGNGYAWFSRDDFNAKSDAPCYIPQNAEDESDIFNYASLLQLCKEFAEENPKYMKREKVTPEKLVQNMYDTIEWECPFTWLDQLTRFD